MPEKVIDGYREMECTQCKTEWVAMCHELVERLQCPQCGYMVQVEPDATIQTPPLFFIEPKLI